MSDGEIDDLVDRWHQGEGAGKELHEFLGMTWDEYARWVTDPGADSRPTVTGVGD